MGDKVLVVDDDTVFSQMVQYWLSKNGIETDLCENGGMACDMIQENKYRFILIDYFLPALKGDEVCQSVREHPASKNTPIIMMTAFTDYKKEYFLERGATEVLFKPVSYEDLMDVANKYPGE